MDEQIFPIQVSPASLSDFLQIKSGGQQFSELHSLIQPTIDIVQYIYESTFFVNASFAGAGPGLSQLALNGGRGVYKITGFVAGSILNGTTQGRFRVFLGFGPITVDVFNVLLAPSTISNQVYSIDTFVDLRNATPTSANLNYQTPVSPTDSLIISNLKIQRVI